MENNFHSLPKPLYCQTSSCWWKLETSTQHWEVVDTALGAFFLAAPARKKADNSRNWGFGDGASGVSDCVLTHINCKRSAYLHYRQAYSVYILCTAAVASSRSFASSRCRSTAVSLLYSISSLQFRSSTVPLFYSSFLQFCCSTVSL